MLDSGVAEAPAVDREYPPIAVPLGATQVRLATLALCGDGMSSLSAICWPTTTLWIQLYLLLGILGKLQRELLLHLDQWQQEANSHSDLQCERGYLANNDDSKRSLVKY
jgi:hypothetical protein